MADYDDDGDDVAGEGGSGAVAAFDPTARVLQACVQFHAQQQRFAELKAVCERALAGAPSSPAAAAELEFWRCFALSRSGDHAAAIAGLDALLLRPEGSELGLPCVALLLSTHSAVQPAKARDKRALLELKGRLKVVSKQSSESSLLLAGRYFLATGKIPKARQCIEKLIAKDKKNVTLLSLFGWIYLLSGEAKYEEKSMQVFKKAAKLTLPNFDILALLGRARYFEAPARNVPKALQALDSLIKIYPLFLPALEEKLRLLALAARFAEVPKVVADLRAKRRQVLGDAAPAVGEDSVAIAFAAAYESLTSTSGIGGKHTEAVRHLLAALAREESAPNGYWLWQYAQLFLRLARGSGQTDAVLLLLSDTRDSAATASAGSKGPLLTSLQLERGLLSYRRGDWSAAQSAFVSVSETVLTVEKAAKDEEEDKGAEGAPGKVNEDERWMKAQAFVHVALTHLAQGQLAEATQALQALPEDVSNYTSAAGEPAPLPSLHYARAALAWSQSKDVAAASSALAQMCEAQEGWMRERNPSDGTLGQPANSALQGVNRFFMHFDPPLLLAAARLGLALVGVEVPDASFSSLPDTRPAAAGQEATLSALAAALAHLTSPAILPGHAEAWALQALVAWVLSDSAAASAALEKVETLEGSLPRVMALKRAVQDKNASAAEASAAKASPAAASPAKASRPLPLASAVLSRAAAATPAKPILQPQPSMLNFDDDDDDEDGGALFKGAADAVDEEKSAPLTFSALKSRASRDADLELEAQAVLDEMESRAGALAAKKAEQARALELERVRLENERRRAREEELRRAAEVEAALALEKASKADQRLAEARKAEEIAALRALREAEKKRQMEAIEQAEREREERREADRQERLRKRAAAEALAAAGHAAAAAAGATEVTPIQAFGDAAAVAASAHTPSNSQLHGRPQAQQPGLKWNQLPEPSPSPMASPLSLAQSPTGAHPAASPLSAAPSLSLQGPASPTSAVSLGPVPSPRHGDNSDALPLSCPPGNRQPSREGAAAQQHAYAQQQQLQQHQQQHQQQALQQMQQQQLQQQTQQDEAALRAQQQRDKIAEASAQIEAAKKFTKVAFWGEVFLKHGRRGSPHERNVTLEVTGSELKFDWSSGQLKAHKSALTLVEGKGTPVFARPTAADSPPERCFSIVTAGRTLDLEATSEATRDKWVTGIKLLLRYLK